MTTKIYIVAREVSFSTTFARAVPFTLKEVATSANDIKPKPAQHPTSLHAWLAFVTPVSIHAVILLYERSDLRWYDRVF